MADFLERYGEKLLEAIVVHLQYVFVSVGIGLVVALILGILLSRVPKLSSVIIPVVSIFQTIPGRFLLVCCSSELAYSQPR